MFGRKRKKKKLAGSAKPLRNDGETEATDSTTAREQKRGSRKSTALHKQPPMTIRQKLEAFFGSRKRDLPSFLEEKGHLVSPSSSPSVSDVGRVSPVASTVPPPQQSVPPVVPQSPPPAIVARNSLSPVICRPSPIHPPVQDDELRAEVPPPPEDPSACSVPPPLPHRDEDAEVAVVISNDAKANCDGEGHSSRADDLFPPQRPSPRSLPEPDIDSATRFEGDTPPPRHDDDDDAETPPTPPARSPSPRPTAVDPRVPLCAEDSPPPLSSRSAESDGDGDDDDKEPLPPSTSMRGHDELPPLPLPRDVPEPGLERALLPWPRSLSSRSPQPDGGVRGMSPDTRESVLEPYETDDDRRLTESKALSDEALPCTMSSSPPPDERDRPAETVALPLQENDEAVSIAAEMNEEETEVDERTVELTEEGRIAADVTPSAAAVAAEQADAATQETTERLVHNCLSAALATSTTSKPALNHLTRSRPMSASNRKRPTSSRRAKALGITLGPQTKEVIEPPRDVSELAEGDKEKEQQPRSELSSRFKSNRPLSSPNLAHELKGALFARAQSSSGGLTSRMSLPLRSQAEVEQAPGSTDGACGKAEAEAEAEAATEQMSPRRGLRRGLFFTKHSPRKHSPRKKMSQKSATIDALPPLSNSNH